MDFNEHPNNDASTALSCHALLQHAAMIIRLGQPEKQAPDVQEQSCVAEVTCLRSAV